MNLPQALARCRTLVVDGADGIGRSGLLAELAHRGFLIRRSPDGLHHVDPTGPYRELLASPGRLALDGSLVHELVYGPLLRGQSRVTWIQALDFAESVAERDGAFLHLTAPRQHPRPAPADFGEAADAFARAFRTLAQHVPVVALDATEHDRPIRSSALAPREPGWNSKKLTVFW